MVFNSAPRLTGQRFKYVQIDPDTKSRDIKNAIDLLTLARVIRPIHLSSANGLPLGAEINPQKYKLSFLDVGLMQSVCGLHAESQHIQNIMQINRGAIAEQFVAQELRAYVDPHQDASLYFWASDKKTSMAEIDCLFPYGEKIFPLEVKAGHTGTLKSLRAFLTQKQVPFGIRIWEQSLSFHDNVLSVPLYMIAQIPRLMEDVYQAKKTGTFDCLIRVQCVDL